MNLIEQIAYHLESCGLGRVSDTDYDGDIFWGRMPDPPDDCICVYSTDSAVPGARDGARIQIINRAKSPRKAYETACAIGAELDGFMGFLYGGGSQVHVTVENCAAGLGGDTKKRELYSTNIRVYYCM